MILYRVLAPFIGLIFILRALWAVLRGSEDVGSLRERLLGPTIAGSAIWVHGASVGEMNAARPIITHLARSHTVLVTATTTTGRATVRNWDTPRVHAALAPLDWRWITRAMLRRNRITALVIIENELWPNRIATCHAAGIPILMINARMSANSARTWSKFAGLASEVLTPMRLVSPQDPDSASRLQVLGVKPDAIAATLNLKSFYAPTLSDIPAQLRRFDRDSTILAAATHEGEETIVLAAFKIIRAQHPDMQLIIAPRHPVRSEAIAQEITQAGLTVAYRSSDDMPDAGVFLADTLGEMHLWYRLAGVAFVGGSLVPKGGHTPFEPTAYGCPILHGPHVENFKEPYAKLAYAQAAVVVNDAPTLATAAMDHVGDTAMADRAKTALDQADIAPLLDAINAVLHPDT